jgi:hypothetical protein
LNKIDNSLLLFTFLSPLLLLTASLEGQYF